MDKNLLLPLIQVVWIGVMVFTVWRRIRPLLIPGKTLKESLEAAALKSREHPAPPRPVQNPKSFFFLLYVVGALVAGLAVVVTGNTMQFVFRAARATGEIVDVARESSRTFGRKHRRTSTYRPIIRYQPKDGPGITFESHLGSDLSSRPSLGTQVQVLYDPQDPHHASLNLFTDLWVMPLALSLFTIFYWVVLLFVARSQKPRDPPPSPLNPRGDIPTLIR